MGGRLGNSEMVGGGGEPLPECTRVYRETVYCTLYCASSHQFLWFLKHVCERGSVKKG